MNIEKIKKDVTARIRWDRFRNGVWFCIAVMWSLEKFCSDNAGAFKWGFLFVGAALVVLYIWWRQEREWQRVTDLFDRQEELLAELKRRGIDR